MKSTSKSRVTQKQKKSVKHNMYWRLLRSRLQAVRANTLHNGPLFDTGLCLNIFPQGGPGPRSCHKMVLDGERKQLFILGRFVDPIHRTSQTVKVRRRCDNRRDKSARVGFNQNHYETNLINGPCISWCETRKFAIN